MARMHSRKRGHSGSKKPLSPTKPTWIRYKPKEVELLVNKLAKEGKTTSEIGIVLRDSYGIPSVKLLAGKRITEVLAGKKLLPELPEDMLALMRTSVALRKHMTANKHDMTAKRGWQLTESKIKRLVKYYKNSSVLPADWKYDPTQLKRFVE